MRPLTEFVEQLILTLEKEEEIYNEVLELAKEKKQVIIDNDINRLEEITKREKGLIITLGKIDNIRIKIVNEILKENNIDSVENITELSKFLDQEAKLKITRLKNKLSHLIDNVKTINHTNNDLVKQQLDYINFNVDLLTKLDMNSSNYNQKASDKTKRGRKNLFDAKV